MQTNNKIISQGEFLPIMITRAITAKRSIDHNIHEIRSFQPTITEEKYY